MFFPEENASSMTSKTLYITIAVGFELLNWLSMTFVLGQITMKVVRRIELLFLVVDICLEVVGNLTWFKMLYHREGPANVINIITCSYMCEY